jgi:hypothetical protein
VKAGSKPSTANNGTNTAQRSSTIDEPDMMNKVSRGRSLAPRIVPGGYAVGHAGGDQPKTMMNRIDVSSGEVGR